MVPLLKFRFTGGDRERTEERATTRMRQLRGPIWGGALPLLGPRAQGRQPRQAGAVPRGGVGRPLTLGDAVLGRQQPLLEEALQHGADGRPVHQLQHEQVGLQGRCRAGVGQGHGPGETPGFSAAACPPGCCALSLGSPDDGADPGHLGSALCPHPNPPQHHHVGPREPARVQGSPLPASAPGAQAGWSQLTPYDDSGPVSFLPHRGVSTYLVLGPNWKPRGWV